MEVRHSNADVNGISLHVAEQGSADRPAVLLLHGFPQLWLSWRDQMAALSSRGFRAIAPDLRGYGDSDAPLIRPPIPSSISSGSWSRSSTTSASPRCSWLGTTGARWWRGTSACSGRTWRAPWSPSGAVLSSPAYPDDGILCGARRWFLHRAVPGVHHLLQLTEYGCSFVVAVCSIYLTLLGQIQHACMLLQEPGRAERAFGRYDVATVLKKFYAIEIDELVAPPGVELIDFLQAPSSPLPWITDEEPAQYAEKFQKSGFTGPLNYYRTGGLLPLGMQRKLQCLRSSFLGIKTSTSRPSELSTTSRAAV